MTPPRTITLHAPAKVNLALKVGSPRPDGMHPIASWFIALDFGDSLTLTASDRTHHDIAFAQDAPRGGVVDWSLDKDLGVRAHRLLEAESGRELPLQLTLRKRIPTGAGLGGGSSDAAAVLVGVNRLYGLGLGEAALIGSASKLGSDVPFFVAAQHGCPSAIVTGVGQAIEPAARRDPLHLTLMFPDVACPTGPVYQAFDALGTSTPCDGADVRAMATMKQVRPEDPFNDLAAAAATVQPVIGQLQRELAAMLARPIHVSGSGSTLFALAWDAREAEDLARRATRLCGLPARAVRSL